MDPYLTLFTPTYNRASLLQRVYESLQSQEKKNFEWLIIDDGSTDNTKEIVADFIQKNEFSIRYFYQENSGKHMAINSAAKLAKTDWFVFLDSDDWLTSDATEEISLLAKKIEKNNEIGGLAFLMSFNTKKNENPSFESFIAYDNEAYFKRGLTNDLFRIIKTDVLRKFPFPVFEGEKFCRESLVFRRIGKNHQFLYSSKSIYRADYQEDGLSSNAWERMKGSPNYTLLTLSEFTQYKNIPYKERLAQATIFWNLVLQEKKTPPFKAFKMIPLNLSIAFFTKKIKSKLFAKFS